MSPHWSRSSAFSPPANNRLWVSYARSWAKDANQNKDQTRLMVERKIKMNDKVIAVTGATGQQGGVVARKLLVDGWKVRALTRDEEKPAAQELASLGAEIVPGDMEDRAELDAAFKGAYGVFSVQNYWLPNVQSEGEIKQGKNVADAAKAA